jgi:hypothetical protein
LEAEAEEEREKFGVENVNGEEDDDGTDESAEEDVDGLNGAPGVDPLGLLVLLVSPPLAFAKSKRLNSLPDPRMEL